MIRATTLERKHYLTNNPVCAIQFQNLSIKFLGLVRYFLRSTKENAFIVRSDFENFGPFIDTDLAPPKNSSGAKLFRENDVVFIDHVLNLDLRLSLLCLRNEVATCVVSSRSLPRVLVCFLVVFDLLFAFVMVSCRILDSASLFILYVHEHDCVGFEMLTVETAVFDCIC